MSEKDPDWEEVPHDCPVCKLAIRDLSDSLSYEEYQCCTDCRDHFAFRDRDAWMRGERPPPEEIEEFRRVLGDRVSYLIRKL